jgi:hypothetical protein
MQPFVFFVGCARSGTTLLQRVVHAHARIAITPEMHWITDYFREPRWLGPEGRVTPEQLARMVEQKRFRQLDMTREEFQGLIGPDEPVSYAPFLERLFGVYGRIKQKPLVGNKTPAYVSRIPVLHGLWPRARFVHLIRDGRDVCLSVLSWNHAHRAAGRYATWQEDRVTTTALWWKRKVTLGRQGGLALGPDLYYEMRYEDLVAHPEEACRKLCAFLGVPYDSAMLRFHEGHTREEPGLDAKQAWRPITPGLRDWRTQMVRADIERFEAVAGTLLEQLGYARVYLRPSPEAINQARKIRELFTQDLHSRREALPECW